MKNTKRKVKLASLLCISMILTHTSTALAGEWKYDGQNWSNVETSGKVNTGWYSEGVDDWYYLDENGKMLAGWFDDFHLHEVNDGTFGRMDYGWYFDGMHWYFLNTSHEGAFGAKVRGWQWIDGYCYYFDNEGTLLVNTITPDGYNVDADGHWLVDGVTQYIAGKGFCSTHIHDSGEKSNNSWDKINSGESEVHIENQNESISLFTDTQEMKDFFIAAETVTTEGEKDQLRLHIEHYLKRGIEEKKIVYYSWNDDKNSVILEYPTGMLEILELWPEQLEEEPSYLSYGTDLIPVDTIEDIIDDQQSLKNNKAIILSAFTKKDEEAYYASFKELNEKLNDFASYDFDSQIIYGATIEDYKKLDDYGMIFICAHGNVESTGWWRWKEVFPIIDLGEEVTAEKQLKYVSDICEKRILICTSSFLSHSYCITPKFVDYYYDLNNSNKLEGAFVYSCTCLGFANDVLANSFINAGSDVFVGFSNAVGVKYNSQILDEMMNCMLDGDTIEDAINSAVDLYGIHDAYYNPKDVTPAYPRIAGNSNFKLMNESIWEPTFQTFTSDDGTVTITVGIQ